MKTIFTKLIATIFFLMVICLIMPRQIFTQTTPITLNFSGKDATTSNNVPLLSVKVSNLTQGGDTTLWGDTPSLILQESYGIFEMNHSQNASFTLEPNFPNPFAETTTVSILLEDRQDLKLTLYDQQGAVAAILELELGRGAHRFEVAVPQNRLCLLSVSDGSANRTLKLFSTAGSSSRIKYLAWDENTALKTGNETTAFGFQPGDMLEYTVNAAGYYEYTTFDNPAQSTPYVFELQANTTQLPPTVTTAAVSNITATTASCGGNVSDEGSAAVTARGVCWSTAPNPTTANNFTTDGAGTGAFTSSMTNLAESTTYYVRAYASNQFGIAYGNEVNFTTTALEPVYVCDSAITYSSEWGTEKVIFTSNDQGQILKGLYKILNTTYGVWINSGQYLCTYDASGNRLSSTGQDWNTTFGTWVNDYQYLYTYDASGNMLSITYQDWNSTIGSWVNDWQYLYTYDASGNRLSETNQDWNSTIGSWVNNWQYLYTYDASGNRLSETYQDWNTTIGSWVNYGQYLYTYDASGNKLSYTYQEWNSTIGSWVNDWQVLYTYDDSGNILFSIGQGWNSTIGSWVNQSKGIYTYDASGNELTATHLEWDSTIGSWVNNYKTTFTYDTSGNRLSEAFQEWNPTIGDWVYYLQNLYSWDEYGNQLSYSYQTWNTSFGAWENNWKHECTYDYTIKKLTWMYYIWSGGWISEYYGPQHVIYMNDDFLWVGSFNCNKIEVWWDEYPAGADNKMPFPGLPSDISKSHGFDENHMLPGHPVEQRQPGGHHLPEMSELKELQTRPFEGMPDFSRNEKPMPEFEFNKIKNINK
ncbi:MAG: DUF3836 domain-containing protein [Bacteroidales bacterium]|nr:DUF3836 domain-containing protein [Bacteroidales bacterium]